MGKAKEAQSTSIQLDKPRRVYQVGEKVTGSVLHKVEVPHGHVTLQLKLCGKAMVAFSRSREGQKRAEHHVAKETYIEKRILLWPQKPQGHRQDHASHMLGIGHHEFPFSFKLPSDIPSSFHCGSGNICYYLKAKLDVGTKSTEAKEFFIVYQPLDLKDVPYARVPIEEEKEKTLCSMCCAAGSVSARLYLPKTGFVPGEAIPVYADITNDSNVRTVKTRFSIEQITHCHTFSKTDTTCSRLETDTRWLEQGEIGPGQSAKWTGKEAVRVPVTVPTGLRGSRLIDLEHQLVLYVIPSGASCSMKLGVDIVIGTVPLQHSGEGAALDHQENWALSHVSGHSRGKGLRKNRHEDIEEAHSMDRESTWESGYITTQV